MLNKVRTPYDMAKRIQIGLMSQSGMMRIETDDDMPEVAVHLTNGDVYNVQITKVRSGMIKVAGGEA